jgi:hypothetical protein
LGGGATTAHLLLNKAQLLAVANADEVVAVTEPSLTGIEAAAIDPENKVMGSGTSSSTCAGLDAAAAAAAARRRRPPGTHKFLVTAELAKLMRWMRVIGIDCRHGARLSTNIYTR